VWLVAIVEVVHVQPVVGGMSSRCGAFENVLYR
jgi:hypothetical protein